MAVSMTGFGRAKGIVGNYDITVEIKSVNNRFLELSSRIPRAYQFLEEKLKSAVKSKVSRGKLDLSVLIDDVSGSDAEIAVNDSYVQKYLAAAESLSKKYKIKNDLKISSLITNGEVFKTVKKDIDESTCEEAVMSVLEKALDNFILMRETEGEKLKADVLSRADMILEKVKFIESRSEESVNEYKLKLEQKISEILNNSDFDESRVLTEVAIFADKVAVDEETVRLKSHISQLRSVFESGDPIGRKLDFIVQEMNRETNTIGSKAQSIEITSAVVDMKSEIEKIREQIQNIE